MAQEETDFFNPYRLLRRQDGSLWTLGNGRLGAVYKACHESTKQEVALRIVEPRFVGPETPSALARLRQISGSVHSPSIAEIRDVLAVDGKMLLVEEYAPGDSLEQLVAQRGSLSTEIALSVAGQAAEALDMAHKAGWIHGGIKPSNLLGSKLGPVLRLKMTGYGLHQAIAGAVPANTDFSRFDITHASPEQIAGQAPDALTDIYSLGSTLWYIVTGMPPFDLDPANAAAHRRFLFASPKMTESMNDLFLRMLATDPAARPQSAAELLKLVDACVSDEDLSDGCAATMVGSSAKSTGSAKSVVLNVPTIRINPGEGANADDDGGTTTSVPTSKVTSDSSADTVVGASIKPANYGKEAPKISPDYDPSDESAVTMVPSGMKPAVDEKSAAKSAGALDENIQFTAYRPKTVRPARWAKLLVFAHLDERPPWMDEDERGPLEEVAAQAQLYLGDKIADYRATTDDSRLAIPRDGEITLLPSIKGVEFDPPQRSFFWKDGVSVHAETFEMRASAALDGQIARGQVTIFLGALILAEINLAIRVDSRLPATGRPAAEEEAGSGRERSSARPFRRIFASYSHRDLDVVESVERHARTLGDDYLRDSQQLRSGESWNSRLLQMIDQADVFQLFWSTNAASSEFVQQEWRHALALCRNTFVRPTYWQDPMPPPPGPLQSLHFHRLGVTAMPAGPAGQSTSTHPRLLPPGPEASDTPVPRETRPVPPPPPPTYAASPPLPPLVSTDSSRVPGSRISRKAALSTLAGVCVAMMFLFVYHRSPGPGSAQVAMNPPATTGAETGAGKPPVVVATTKPVATPDMAAAKPTSSPMPTTSAATDGGDTQAHLRQAAAARITRVPGANDAMRQQLLGVLDHAHELRLLRTIPIVRRPTRPTTGPSQKRLPVEPPPGEIDRVIEALHAGGEQAIGNDPTLMLVILGYADEGDPQRSISISQQCADATLKALQKRGGPPAARAIGMGNGGDLPANDPANPSTAPGQRFVEVWAANL